MGDRMRRNQKEDLKGAVSEVGRLPSETCLRNQEKHLT